MNLRTDWGSTFYKLSKDSVLRVFVILFILLHIPHFLPAFSAEQINLYNWVLSTVFLLPFIVIMLWPSARVSLPDHERKFWALLSLGFSLWWVVSLINLLAMSRVWLTSFTTLKDFLYLGFYICWFLALSLTPHDKQHDEFKYSDRWLLGTGTVVLSVSSFVYFVQIPSWFAPEYYATWLPSMLLFSVMDIILAVALIRLAITAATRPWRLKYGMLLASIIGFALVDVLEATDYAVKAEWMRTNAMSVIWSLPLLLMAIVARARKLNIPEPASENPDCERNITQPGSLFSPIILMSFILPVLHIALEQFEHLHEELKKTAGMVVLVSLCFFWALALVENRELRRVSLRFGAQAAENERLRVKQKVAEESERVKDQFLANVSHEIRTPMNGILGMSEIIVRGDLNEEQREQVELVRISAQGLISVIDDILVHSRVQTGQLSFMTGPFNLRDIAESVMDVFRVEKTRKHIGLDLELQDGTPLDIKGDPRRLREVLVKLVGNAVKFTSEGAVKVRFSCTEKSTANVRIRCEVIDSGIGIDPEHAEELFKPFSQADSSASRKYGGSGLGLATSKLIIEAQSGRIGASGSPGTGSTFWFEIPYKLDMEKAAKVKDEAEQEFALKSDGRILLAEDNEINQIVAVAQLESLGQKADVVANGNEVLEALQEHSYALILMDCQMPELDGIEATRLIREKGYSKSDLPVVALTAHVLDEDRERCLNAGMNDFLSKPLSLEQLRETLHHWL